MTHLSQPIDQPLSMDLNAQLDINLHGYPYVICYITVPTGGSLGFEGSADYGENWTSIDVTDLSDLANPADISSVTADGVYAINTVFRCIRITTLTAGSVNGRIVGTAYHSTVENTSATSGGATELLGSVVNDLTGDVSVAEMKPFFEYIFFSQVDPRLWIETLDAGFTTAIDSGNSSVVVSSAGEGSGVLISRKTVNFANRITICRFTAKVNSVTTGIIMGYLNSAAGYPTIGIGFGYQSGSFYIAAGPLDTPNLILSADWDTTSFIPVLNQWFLYEIRVYGSVPMTVTYHIYNYDTRKLVQVHEINRMESPQYIEPFLRVRYPFGVAIRSSDEIELHNILLGIKNGPELASYPVVTDSFTTPQLPDPTQNRIARIYKGVYSAVNFANFDALCVSGIITTPGTITATLKIYTDFDIARTQAMTPLYTNSIIEYETSFVGLTINDMGILRHAFSISTSEPFSFDLDIEISRYLASSNGGLLFWVDSSTPVTLDLNIKFRENP